jgi:nucleoside-diphosphate-sugar epimerase
MVAILVTGGTGYIGNATARALRNAGHIVYGLVGNRASAYHLSLANLMLVMILLIDTQCSW